VLIEMTQKTTRKEQCLEDGDVSFTLFWAVWRQLGKTFRENNSITLMRGRENAISNDSTG